MGCASSSNAGAFNPNASSTDLNHAIPDRYETFVSRLSDRAHGRTMFYCTISVIAIIGRTLQPFDDDNLIPAFGFGDATTSDKGVFPFLPDGKPCRGFDEVLTRYDEITPQIKLAGPTNFAPIIYEAIRQVKATHAYHILVIVADGQITSEKETAQAIVEASKYALSIIVVGVGDGPWDLMEHYDDTLPLRKFDNFQFVDFNRVMKLNPVNPDVGFATAALMEIPGKLKKKHARS
ncbi:Copine-like protein, partial [Globisporangium splendens]